VTEKGGALRAPESAVEILDLEKRNAIEPWFGGRGMGEKRQLKNKREGHREG